MLRLNLLALNALVLNSYAHYWLQGDVKNIKVIYWSPIGPQLVNDKDSIDIRILHTVIHYHIMLFHYTLYITNFHYYIVNIQVLTLDKDFNTTR